MGARVLMKGRRTSPSAESIRFWHLAQREGIERERGKGRERERGREMKRDSESDRARARKGER